MARALRQTILPAEPGARQRRAVDRAVEVEVAVAGAIEVIRRIRFAKVVGPNEIVEAVDDAVAVGVARQLSRSE